MHLYLTLYLYNQLYFQENNAMNAQDQLTLTFARLEDRHGVGGGLASPNGFGPEFFTWSAE